jgi:hypothetical protein
MTIKIPDDLARRLEGIATSQKKDVQQVAIEGLRSLVGGAGSPGSILRAMREPPHLRSSAVDDLEAAIADGRLPVRAQGAFDKCSSE